MPSEVEAPAPAPLDFVRGERTGLIERTTGVPQDRVPATDGNFEDALYLAANPDVARRYPVGEAWRHFDRHGRAEGRTQLTPEAAGLVGSKAARKYARFADVLDAGAGAGGEFRFLGEARSFPVAYGDAPTHDLSDYDAESDNPGLSDFVDACRDHPAQRFMEVGCGRRRRRFANCLYLEVYPSEAADLLMAPACRYPIADNSLDGIGCFAVLEHTTEPWEVAREFHRMLKPGGTLYVDWPFLVPVHGYPSHYYNATREGLRRMFEAGFETVSLDTRLNQTPDHVLHWMLNGLSAALADDALRAELAAMTVAELMAEAPGGPLWARVIAALPAEAISTYAAGSTLVARKI